MSYYTEMALKVSYSYKMFTPLIETTQQVKEDHQERTVQTYHVTTLEHPLLRMPSDTFT